GDVAAVAAALDDRIAGVMVNNFGGPEPENGYPLPPDAELWFQYTSSGSWESTRNLRLSARDGFLPWTIIASLAPRRLVYYHEFYWDREQDPVWKRLQTIYGFYNSVDRLAGLSGHGFVVGSSPENTHWTPQSRELLYPAFELWFDIPNPKQEYDKLFPEEQLLCLTTSAANSNIRPAEERPAALPLYRICSQLGADRGADARRKLARLSAAEQRARLRTQWTELLGDISTTGEPIVANREQELLGDVCVERIQLRTEPGIIVPVVLLVPNSSPPQSEELKRGTTGTVSRRVVVAISQSGIQHFLHHRNEQIAELLDADTAVCLLDVRGTGETDPGDGRGRRSAASSISSSELMLGQTLVGARLRDLRQVVRYLRERDELNGDRVVLWGDSFAATNALNCNFAIPHGISGRPHQSEPLGGLLALLAALFDEEIEAVYVHGGLTGFHHVLASPFCYLPHDVVVPGVLTTGDLCDVAAAIAPRRLRLDSLVDGLNRPQTVELARQQYATTAKSYRQANASQNFEITLDQPSIAQWLPRNYPAQPKSAPKSAPQSAPKSAPQSAPQSAP
ncbi:MAG: hypothetical protein ACI9HK_003730, partial [Pirellulaceae bacterium]